MQLDVFISTTPFGEADPAPREALEQSGFSFLHNSLGRKMTPEEVAEYAAEATVLIAGTENLMPLLERSGRLRMIARVGIGLDKVPLAECRRRGIKVSWTPDAVTPAVAELTIGLMISVTRFVPQVDRGIRMGHWRRPSGRRLQESVIGIAGMGRIGGSVAKLLTSFRPKLVLVADRADKTKEITELQEQGLNIKAATMDDLLEQSDILTLHLPSSRLTHHIINGKSLARMKSNSFLINSARGELIDEAALERALVEGRLGGAAIDTFETEPYRGSLCKLEHVVVTSHLGSCSIDCRARMEGEAAAEALRFLRGESLNQEVPNIEYDYQAE